MEPSKRRWCGTKDLMQGSSKIITANILVMCVKEFLHDKLNCANSMLANARWLHHNNRWETYCRMLMTKRTCLCSRQIISYWRTRIWRLSACVVHIHPIVSYHSHPKRRLKWLTQNVVAWGRTSNIYSFGWTSSLELLNLRRFFESILDNYANNHIADWKIHQMGFKQRLYVFGSM